MSRCQDFCEVVNLFEWLRVHDIEKWRSQNRGKNKKKRRGDGIPMNNSDH